MRETAGSAAAAVARCRNRRRGSLILNLPSHHSITSSAPPSSTLPLTQRYESLRLDACKPDHLGPFIDIFGDELGKFVGCVRWHRHGAVLSEALIHGRVSHRRVDVLVARRQ